MHKNASKKSASLEYLFEKVNQKWTTSAPQTQPTNHTQNCKLCEWIRPDLGLAFPEIHREEPIHR